MSEGVKAGATTHMGQLFPHYSATIVYESYLRLLYVHTSYST